MPRKGPHPYRVPIVRYHDADGRRCLSSTPGALKTVVLSDSYYADIWANKKRERINLETTNISVAWTKLRAELKRRHDEALGIRDRFTDAAERLLADHLTDWLAVVAAGQVAEGRVGELRHLVELLVEEAGWTRITHIDRSQAVLALARLQEPGTGERQRKKGRSAQTRNHITSAARQFSCWLAAEGHLPRDPLAGLDKVNVEVDRRHDRRTPTAEEIALLFEYLAREGCEVRAGMAAGHRALLYRVAMATGLRASELRALTRASFDLDGAAVVLPAKRSKRRKEDRLPLPPWLVIMLREWFAVDGACFAELPPSPGRDMLAFDLAGAGITYAQAGAAGHDLYFDFHSLRHWFSTWAAHVPGISPRTLLALTRHSSVELAMGTYGTTQKDDVRAAMDHMPDPTTRPPKKEE